MPGYDAAMSSMPPNPYGVQPPFGPPGIGNGAHPESPEPNGPTHAVSFNKEGPARPYAAAVEPPPLPGYWPPPAWHPGYSPAWPATRRTSALSGALGCAMFMLGAFVIAAAFLPWGHVHLPGGTTCLVRGIDDAACESYRADYDLGFLTIVLAIPVFVLGLLRACIRRSGMALGAAVTCLVLGLAITVVGGTGAADPEDLPVGADFSVSYGTWLTLGLGIALTIASIWGIVKRH